MTWRRSAESSTNTVGRRARSSPSFQRVQDAYGYLPKELLAEISKRTGIPLTRLMGVATFYAEFRLARRGQVSDSRDGTGRCHVRGDEERGSHRRRVRAGVRHRTSPDYKYTMEIVYCIGSCGLAPVAVVDDKVFGRVEPEELVERVREVERWREVEPTESDHAEANEPGRIGARR